VLTGRQPRLVVQRQAVDRVFLSIATTSAAVGFVFPWSLRISANRSSPPPAWCERRIALSDEVISHLAGLVGADVKVTLEISADVQNGVSEKVVRTVTENCRTLKFKDHGFEES